MSGHGIEDIYRGVISDVINQVREAFLDENVDLEVLQQLKRSWEEKVNESGSVDLNPPKNVQPPTIRQIPTRHPLINNLTGSLLNDLDQTVAGASNKTNQIHQPILTLPAQQIIPSQAVLLKQSAAAQVAAVEQRHAQQLIQTGAASQLLGANFAHSNSIFTELASLAAASHQGRLILQPTGTSGTTGVNAQQIYMQMANSQPNVMLIAQDQAVQLLAQQAAAASSSSGGQQQQALYSSVPPIRPRPLKADPGFIPQLDGQSYNSEFLNMHSNASHHKKNSSNLLNSDPQQNNNSVKTLTKKLKTISQLDGGGPGMSDASSESDLDDDDPLDRFANFEDDKNEGEGIVEEEPLNSDDDQSDDEDLQTLFESENVVVCQFEKVQRTRNKWKFTLKDGIMHIKKKDYCFSKATGEAEW